MRDILLNEYVICFYGNLISPFVGIMVATQDLLVQSMKNVLFLYKFPEHCVTGYQKTWILWGQQLILCNTYRNFNFCEPDYKLIKCNHYKSFQFKVLLYNPLPTYSANNVINVQLFEWSNATIKTKFHTVYSRFSWGSQDVYTKKYHLSVKHIMLDIPVQIIMIIWLILYD